MKKPPIETLRSADTTMLSNKQKKILETYLKYPRFTVVAKLLGKTPNAIWQNFNTIYKKILFIN